MFVARKRGSIPALNPLSGNEHFLLKEKNILANTVEQALVFLMLSLVLTTYLDPSEMKIIPLYSLQWVVGRILFQIVLTPYIQLIHKLFCLFTWQ